MKLSEFKTILKTKVEIAFELPNGQLVPNHFHITEVGQINKNFIDCGGTIRNESVVNFQLWTAEDYDHRLSAEKLNKIIALSEKKLSIEDSEIEVEYQGDTIGKYHLGFDGKRFTLLNTNTNCLAKDNCGIPAKKPKVQLAEVASKSEESCCAPGSGCC